MWGLPKLKNGGVVLLIGIMVFAASSLCQAEQPGMRKELKIILEPKKDFETMSCLELVNILVDIMRLERPAGADSLSDAELFEVLANMLAERGLTLFVDGGPDALVTCGLVANVLYDALIGPSDATIERKIEYLAELGYIDPCDPADVMAASKIIDALNVPALSRAIAEGYTTPGAIGFIGIDLAPSNPAPESWIPEAPIPPAPAALPPRPAPAGAPPRIIPPPPTPGSPT